MFVSSNTAHNDGRDTQHFKANTNLTEAAKPTQTQTGCNKPIPLDEERLPLGSLLSKDVPSGDLPRHHSVTFVQNYKKCTANSILDLQADHEVLVLVEVDDVEPSNSEAWVPPDVPMPLGHQARHTSVNEPCGGTFSMTSSYCLKRSRCTR